MNRSRKKCCRAPQPLPVMAACISAVAISAGASGGVCRSDEPCYVTHLEPGCDNPDCCDAVCNADPFCCETEWDEMCVEAALDACGHCGDPGAGDCLLANGTPGCNDEACCAAACADDPFCCDSNWDMFCVEGALELCVSCGDPGAGNCFVAHTIPACDDEECCNTVCDDDPFCCVTEWDDRCADAAIELCDKDGCDPECPANLDGDVDDQVNAADLAIMLGAWSIPPGTPGCDGTPRGPCCADLTGEGFVNAADLAVLLGAWSIPPGTPGCR